MLFREESTPRWIIYLTDLTISGVSLYLAHLLRFNFAIPEIAYSTFYYVFPIAFVIRAIAFVTFRTYSGILRYTSTKDGQRLLAVTFTGSLIFGLLNIITYQWKGNFIFPYSVIIIDFLISLFMLVSLRLGVKMLYFHLSTSQKQKANIIIFGAGDSGIITKRTLDRDRATSYTIQCFLDDNEKKADKLIEGIPIHTSDRLESLLSTGEVAQLIIAVQHIDLPRKQELVDLCLKYNVKVRSVPPVREWINGELSFNQIKHVRIDELLGRDPIVLSVEKIKSELSGRVILISGASGSIGSELVRQLLRFEPKKLILLDQAESPLYDIEQELIEKKQIDTCEIVMGDIRSLIRVENVFRTYQPEIVFHAAAYKHVPMMENNPSEAIFTNVSGTRNMADMAVKYHVRKFVMVSTDKAVNPTNVMGASKRIAEIYTQSLNNKYATQFITTRFGNVLGSNGSVIPLFRRQIDSGGPVTVTHPEITRYFMTIPEACQLVLEAGCQGEGGEIFVFDMGQSVKILDLAKKMIKLSGLELGKDIEIKFTGLRPGEKLYEELLNDKESTIPTNHKQILKAKVREYDINKVSEDVATLLELARTQQNMEIVSQMKKMVPEYISQNSPFAALDQSK